MEAEASMVADATSELFASLTVAQPCQPVSKPAGVLHSGSFSTQWWLKSTGMAELVRSRRIGGNQSDGMQHT